MCVQFGHESSRAEFHHRFASLLWIPILTPFASIKHILDSALHMRDQPCAIRIYHPPQHPINQQLDDAHASVRVTPPPVLLDWGTFSLDFIQGFAVHAIWKEFRQGRSPIEFRPRPRSLLWNPMLTAVAPRGLTILADFHM